MVFLFCVFFFFFKQKTAYEMLRSLVGSEMCIRDSDVAAGAYDLARLTAGDIAACVGVDRAYGDLGIGLADASLVVLAARTATRSLLTLDERHFRAVRPQQGGAFRLLPADEGGTGRTGPTRTHSARSSPGGRRVLNCTVTL